MAKRFQFSLGMKYKPKLPDAKGNFNPHVSYFQPKPILLFFPRTLDAIVLSFVSYSIVLPSFCLCIDLCDWKEDLRDLPNPYYR